MGTYIRFLGKGVPSMKSRNVVLVTAVAALGMSATFGAAAESTAKAAEASIPFANQGGIRNWSADRDKGLWVQDSRGKWYYAKMFGGTCPGLNFATTLGFDTRTMGSFDRYSAILVPREGRCQIESLIPSDGPPAKQKREEQKQEQAER
jgi:hypothetical protein